MICSNCQSSNSTANDFCGICGGALTKPNSAKMPILTLPTKPTPLSAAVPTTPNASFSTVPMTLTTSSQGKKRWKRKQIAFVSYTICITLVVLGFLAWNLFSHLAATNLGGLDLTSFCRTYGYNEATNSFCTSSLNMTMACRWHYHMSDATAENNDNTDPDGWDCQTAQKTPLGGINDLSHYCQNQYPNGISQAEPKGNGTNEWVCEQKIDPNIACIWEYTQINMEARMTNTLWSCYRL